MKKRYFYIPAILLSGVFVALIVSKYQREEKTFHGMLDRMDNSKTFREWEITKNYASGLLETIKKNPSDVKSILALTTLFIREARITGNYKYYDREGLKYLNRVLKNDSANFEALTFKSLIYLSQHHFADGLAIAEKAQAINPFNAFIYGLLVDGNVEMGFYDSALANAERMISIRPDLRSYSRISYLREIFGDYQGAIEAMKMAVDAGAPNDEATEWTRSQLGRLYENTGDLKNAEMHYTIALEERPGYAYALAGLARIAEAGKNYAKAIYYYKEADSSVHDFSFAEELSEVYKLSGQKQKADSLTNLVINALCEDEKRGQNDENMGHYADRELAYAYLKINNYPKALEHALIEYNRRPDNIDANETVAWVYYCKGEYSKALNFLQTGLKTHSKNPTLLCRAGLIYAKIGDLERAKSILQEALSRDPNISEILKAESRQTLQSLL
jgi:tetratricopeptide (TPR) repeat protein